MTSERHTDILNGYKAGQSHFVEWVQEHLGNIRLISWEWGAIKLHWDIDDRWVMPDGVVFGGHIAAVADHIVGLATMTVLSSNEQRFRTSRLETNFFRPLMRPHAAVDARVTNASKKLIHIEADIHNADEKLAARIAAVQVRRLTG